MSLTQLTELLGWVSVLNISVLILATVLLTGMKKTLLSIHSRMFGIPEGEIAVCYFTCLANYKTLTFVLLGYFLH